MTFFNEQDEKLWNYLQENSFVAKQLFGYDKDNNELDYALKDYWYVEPEDTFYVNAGFFDVKWLYTYQSIYTHIVMIGIHKNENVAYAGNEGEFWFEGKFSEFPYETLECMLQDFETMDEFYQQEPEFMSALTMYEAWCEKENISLNKKSVYFNSEEEEIYPFIKS